MTNLERKVLARLLDIAAEQFSNNGCNDFELLNTPESAALVKESYGDPEWERPSGAVIYASDWALMRLFADRFKEDE